MAVDIHELAREAREMRETARFQARRARVAQEQAAGQRRANLMLSVRALDLERRHAPRYRSAEDLHSTLRALASVPAAALTPRDWVLARVTARALVMYYQGLRADRPRVAQRA
jgi:hypothetical protein